MTFYLKPPRGDIHMEKIFDLCRGRTIFLGLLDKSDNVEDLGQILSDYGHLSESVGERTSKDRISHFVTRLSVSQKPDLIHAFVNIETKLFEYRLESLDNSEIEDALTDVERHLLERSDRNFLILARSVRHIVVSKMLTHPCLSEEDVDQFGSCCCRLSVPFQLVPTLVAKRSVAMSLGQAEITCRIVRHFLANVFRSILKDSFRETRNLLESQDYGFEDDDRRLSVLLDQVRCAFVANVFGQGHLSRSSSLAVFTLKASEIDKMSRFFPLCFQRVHRHLVGHRRLQHHSRIAYTLYLKEIGLTRSEATIFWSSFYQQPSRGCTNCSHSWQADEKKFSYSLDHLYGIAGGRKNYSAHSCSSIQGRGSSPNEQLTCPFAEFEINDLDKLLGLEDSVEKNLILNLRSEPSKACAQFLAVKCGLSERPVLTKPTHYFNFLATRK